MVEELPPLFAASPSSHSPVLFERKEVDDPVVGTFDRKFLTALQSPVVSYVKAGYIPEKFFIALWV